MGGAAAVFRFVQVEVPWELGPPDGRYLLRDSGAAGASHVLVLATLGAPERRRLGVRRRPAAVDPESPPVPVATGRATVIDVDRPLQDEPRARAWLQAAGETELAAGLDVLNRALHAFRVASADPYLPPVGRRHAIAARLGYGAGELVAEGRWSAARELPGADRRPRRRRMLTPEARLAALLGGREAPLACEELALRARLDVDQGRLREAALQLHAALEAAIAELAAGAGAGPDADADALGGRLGELSAQREAVQAAAQAALHGPLDAASAETVAAALGRLEAALRARVAGRA